VSEVATLGARSFKPYVQRGEDRSGLGLGLAIVKQAIAGCVFIVAVPCVAR